MVHDQKSCSLENFPFLRQNYPRWTACDCFISVMKKAIKTCDISFFSPKKVLLGPYFFYSLPCVFTLLKLGKSIYDYRIRCIKDSSSDWKWNKSDILWKLIISKLMRNYHQNILHRFLFLNNHKNVVKE